MGNSCRRRAASGPFLRLGLLTVSEAIRERMEAERKAKADAEAAAWNERPARRMPLLFAATIGAALAARRHFLWVYCPPAAPRETLTYARDRHRDAAVTSLIPLAVVPLVLATCATCRACAALQD
jgi:hypothetical protein